MTPTEVAAAQILSLGQTFFLKSGRGPPGHLSYFQNNIQEIYSTQKCAEHWLPLGTQRAQKPQVATKKGQNGTDVCQKSQNFLGCRGCAPERRVVKQAAAKQAAAKLLKLGQMKEKANGCQQKVSKLSGLIYK